MFLLVSRCVMRGGGELMKGQLSHYLLKHIKAKLVALVNRIYCAAWMEPQLNNKGLTPRLFPTGMATQCDS